MPTEIPKTFIQKLKDNFHDALYVIGSLLIVTGFAFISRPAALIIAGSFLLLFPVLEIVSGFLRGLRK